MPFTPTPLVLIAGLARLPALAMAERFRAVPGTAVVDTPGEATHGCVSCAMREDLLPLLVRLARQADVDRIVVRLDETLEPEPVCVAIRSAMVDDEPMTDLVRIEAVVTVVDDATWLDDATGDVSVAERGLPVDPDDDRTLAQVAVAQVEFADVLVCAGRPADTWTAARTVAVHDRIAPGTPRLPFDGLTPAAVLAAVPPGARRGEPSDPHEALLRGQPPLDADCGVAIVLFTDHRPFHPGRLYDAVDVLLDGVVRARGRVWVASRPDAALWVESAGGGLGIAHAGEWLAADDGPSWDDVSAERRALASLRWHPRFGDRAQELVIVVHRAAPGEIQAALSRALLTDRELAAGPQAWARYDDPFGDWHHEPSNASGGVEGSR